MQEITIGLEVGLMPSGEREVTRNSARVVRFDLAWVLQNGGNPKRESSYHGVGEMDPVPVGKGTIHEA